MSRTNDTRFRKGKSGNPNGRPRKTVVENSTFDILFDRPVSITVGGEQREVSQEEALLLRMYEKAVAGNTLARRKILRMINQHDQAWAAKAPPPAPVTTRMELTDPTNAFDALRILGITKPDPAWLEHGDGTRLHIETWAAQKAIDRHPRREWSDAEIRNVHHFTDNTVPLRWPKGSRR